MKTKSSHQQTVKLVQIALMSAIVVVIQLFFASVKIGPVTIAFSIVPLVLAGICIDPYAGLIVGAVSGIVTFLQVLTSGDYFYMFLITNNPLATALICITKTAIAGWLAGIVYRAVQKATKNTTLGSILASIICPTVNTGIFCLGMLLFFTPAFQADATFGAMSENIIYFVLIGLAGINFIIELISTVVITPIIQNALIAARVFKK